MPATVIEQFTNSARKFPDRKALVLGNSSRSYQALYQRSFFIASKLSQYAGQSPCNVGIFVDKRFEAIEAILGVMASGHAYVPMDVKNPRPRLQHICTDSQIRFFVTTADLLEPLVNTLECLCSNPENSEQKFDVLVMSDIEEYSPQTNDINPNIRLSVCFNPNDNTGTIPPPAIDENDLAVTFYTSGSTGAPKGAMIDHCAINTFVDWAADYFEVTENDCAISHAPLNFDLSLFDLFVCLSKGASILLIPEKMAGNPRYITAQMQQTSVTLWQSVPSALSLLVKYGQLERYSFASIRHVLFAGEKMPNAVLKSLLPHFNKAYFHNVYGATETNDSFVYSFPATIDLIPFDLPIGKPLPYVSYKILDESGIEIKSDNKEGALFIKSKTMMRGYRHQSEQHADNNNEYYQTNDIVKRLPDGSLVFCGRCDDIVKSNGYRVNLLEIEQALKAHPAVREVAVYALPNDDIGHQIAAVISHAKKSQPNSLELKQFCADVLPLYAIPHVIEFREDELPKTSTGKLNKQQLKNERENYVKTA